jgi:hypothetical protein
MIKLASLNGDGKMKLTEEEPNDSTDTHHHCLHGSSHKRWMVDIYEPKTNGANADHHWKECLESIDVSTEFLRRKELQGEVFMRRASVPRLHEDGLEIVSARLVHTYV